MKLRRPARSHVLMVLGIMLAGAGAMRMSLGATVALASAPATSTSDEICPPVDGPADLVAALQQREERVAAREAELDARESELHGARDALVVQLDELESAETELRELLALADRGAEADLAQLTSVYENMKPDDAAALFAAMDPQFAAGFLGRMSPHAAAGILAGLDPAEAYAISAILAGQNVGSAEN